MSDSPIARAFRRVGYQKNVDRLIAEAADKEGLKKNLSAKDLVVLGVAGIIGAGIFVLVGEGADAAGAGVIFAFAIAAVICVFAGYAYAELAAAIPASGSAYAYLYTALGEMPGWMVAWALILEYAVGAIAVAVGWRNNFVALIDQLGSQFEGANRFFESLGMSLTTIKNEGTSYFHHGGAWGDLTHSPLEPTAGIINLPSIAIVLFCTLLLAKGTKESARFTAVLVAIKVAILLMAIGVGFYLAAENNWVNFTENDWFPSDADGLMGATSAVMAAAAIMFFAYIGFDSVSTTAEETKNPKKDLPVGIMGSLIITTVLYILAALALVGAAPWQTFDGNSAAAADARGEPFGYVFEEEGIGWAAMLVRIGALIGTTSVLLVLILGGVRVFFNMSRDGLLPAWMSRVSPKRGNPLSTTLLYGGFTLAFAGFLELGQAVKLVNIGTLFAFLMVIVAAWVFRLRRPDVPRPFTMPLWAVKDRDGRPILPFFTLLGVVGIGFLIYSLGVFTLVAFVTWTGVGLLVYAFYGIRNSREAGTRHAVGAVEGTMAAVAAPAAAAPGAYTHKGYTLYRRATTGGANYFFAKNTPKAGSPAPLPAGYSVGENSKTGLPYLKRA